jgi:hypothetical protein
MPIVQTVLLFSLKSLLFPTVPYRNRYEAGEGGSTPDDPAERQDAVRVAIGCTRKIS